MPKLSHRKCGTETQRWALFRVPGSCHSDLTIWVSVIVVMALQVLRKWIL